MLRRAFLGAAPAALLLLTPPALAATPRKKGVMLMNRIGPVTSELFVANADGSGERKFLAASAFDYHAGFAADGQWVTFTSERDGLGNAELFRCRADGTGIQKLTTSPSVDDAGALSPDGLRLAFVSSRDGFRTNVWVQDIRTRRLRNLTGGSNIQGDPSLPNGFFRPAWSPDGQWLAFSSDRNTDWRGHNDGHGWEHTQELSIYMIRIDGQGFARVASKPDYCLGSPKWSPDGKRVVFYEMKTEDTWGARRPESVAGVVSQIVSVDVTTRERIEHSKGPGLKVFPQFLGGGEISYHRKGGGDEGLAYASGKTGFQRALRSPTWSADGRSVIYEKVTFRPTRPQDQLLYSWDPEWEYRYTDVFPQMSRDGKLVLTEKALNSSIAIMDPDGSNKQRIFDPTTVGMDPAMLARGVAGAFAPAWSPDGQWVAFGVGLWFQERAHAKATIMRVRRDGSGVEALTDGTAHCGFPSYSADGKEVVFRTWSEGGGGLSIVNIENRAIRVLTTEFDNLPGWSPDGARIVFTRRVDAVNFDIFTIRPDGSDLTRLTTSRGNDGHAVWTADGRILWSGSAYGFRDEAALYDNTFQQYGQIWVMDMDGSNKRLLTDSLWEDSMPLFIPAKDTRP